MAIGTLVYVAFVLSFLAYSEGYINPPDYGGALLLLAGAWNLLLLIVTVLVIIDAVRKVRAGMTRELVRGLYFTKLAAIPFFVINFLLMAFFALVGTAIFLFGGMVLQAVAVISIGLTYFAMISTSIYGFASVIQLRRERQLETRMAVIYAVLLCIFIADIVAGILIFRQYRSRERQVVAATASIEE